MSQLNYKKIMEGQLPLDLYKSKDLESEAIGNALNRLQYNVDMLEKDVNPSTSISKGLEQWERFFKLPSNINDNIETRRSRVISELIQFMSDENVIRKDEMESILSLFGPMEIIEHFTDYIFDVVFLDVESLNMYEVVKIIKKIKPAHLGYDFIVKHLQNIVIKLVTYSFDVPYKICNMFQTADVFGGLMKVALGIEEKFYAFDVLYPICNTFVTSKIVVENESINVVLTEEYRDNEVLFKRAGNTTNVGEGDI